MRRRRSWLSTLVLILGVLMIPVVVMYFGYNYLITSAKQSYYSRNYYVVDVTSDRLVAFPESSRLNNVPWYSTDKAYSATEALRMVVAQRGKYPSIGELNFLSGLTYGVSQLPDRLGFSPFTDPEIGLVVAPPRFGLKRAYLVTDDETTFLRAIRSSLSQGRPVRVALDRATLYGQTGSIPHSELLVGYEAGDFEYYEPICSGVAPCEPGESAPGVSGLRMTDRQLLDAVSAQSQWFGYPWKYGYTVFDPADSSLTDLTSIWQRNGVALVGSVNDFGPRSGSEALKVAAVQVADLAEKADTTGLTPGLEAAAYTRRDNAAYLRERFRGTADVEEAAGWLDQAAAAYERALVRVRDGISDKAEAVLVASDLNAAADLERRAGETFAAQAPQPKLDVPPEFAPYLQTPVR